MWWVGDRLEVYIGTRRAAVCRGDRVLHDAQVSALAQALGSMAAWLRSQRRPPRLRVWLSGSLCRPFLLPGLSALGSPDERDRAAQALAGRALDGAAPRFWLAATRRGDLSSLGAAAPEAALLEIEATVLPLCRGRPVIGPWWAEGSRLLASPGAERGAAVVVRDCDSLTLLSAQGRSYDTVRTVASADDRVLEASLQRWRLSGDLEERGVVLLSLSRAGAAGLADPAARPGPAIALAPLAASGR